MYSKMLKEALEQGYEEMEEMAKNYGKKVEELSENENLKKYLEEGIKSEKALEFIVEKAKFVEAKKETKKAEVKEEKKKTYFIWNIYVLICSNLFCGRFCN